MVFDLCFMLANETKLIYHLKANQWTLLYILESIAWIMNLFELGWVEFK